MRSHAIVFALAAFSFQSSTANAQICGLRAANDATCLTLDYVRALGRLQMAAEAGHDHSSADKVADVFYAIKMQRDALGFAQRMLRPYTSSSDTITAQAARYVIEALSIASARNDSNEVSMRRAARGEMQGAQLSESSADMQFWNDKMLELFIAATGAVLDASVQLPGVEGHVSKRRMTTSQRNAILREYAAIFGRKTRLDTNWSAAAGVLRQNLSDRRWRYEQ